MAAGTVTWLTYTGATYETLLYLLWYNTLWCHTSCLAKAACAKVVYGRNRSQYLGAIRRQPAGLKSFIVAIGRNMMYPSCYAPFGHENLAPPLLTLYLD